MKSNKIEELSTFFNNIEKKNSFFKRSQEICDDKRKKTKKMVITFPFSHSILL